LRPKTASGSDTAIANAMTVFSKFSLGVDEFRDKDLGADFDRPIKTNALGLVDLAHLSKPKGGSIDAIKLPVLASESFQLLEAGMKLL
jgi:hypothetical protein